MENSDPLYDLSHALDMTLGCIKQASLDGHVNKEQREALRYLHERIINYYGMMRSRTLTGSIEFLIPYHDGKHGVTTAGWYFRGPALPDAPRNWYGPYASYKQAIDARDKDKPKNRVALSMELLDQMAD